MLTKEQVLEVALRNNIAPDGEDGIIVLDVKSLLDFADDLLRTYPVHRCPRTCKNLDIIVNPKHDTHNDSN